MRKQYVHLTPKALWIKQAIADGADFPDALFLADMQFTPDGMAVRQGSILATYSPGTVGQPSFDDSEASA